ncbi:hypothetical protein L683_09000 [Pseudomonas aeruginosa WC55]|nr:hypothetical protein L683_09000 [Pseudomonas aeruginosa WC55]
MILQRILVFDVWLLALKVAVSVRAMICRKCAQILNGTIIRNCSSVAEK